MEEEVAAGDTIDQTPSSRPPLCLSALCMKERPGREMRAKIWSGGSRVGRTAEEGGGEEGEKEFTILTCCPADRPTDRVRPLIPLVVSLVTLQTGCARTKREGGGRMQCSNFITCKFAGGLALHFYPSD